MGFRVTFPKNDFVVLFQTKLVVKISPEMTANDRPIRRANQRKTDVPLRLNPHVGLNIVDSSKVLPKREAARKKRSHDSNGLATVSCCFDTFQLSHRGDPLEIIQEHYSGDGCSSSGPSSPDLGKLSDARRKSPASSISLASLPRIVWHYPERFYVFFQPDFCLSGRFDRTKDTRPREHRPQICACCPVLVGPIVLQSSLNPHFQTSYGSLPEKAFSAPR